MVDENNTCFVYNIKTSELLFQVNCAHHYNYFYHKGAYFKRTVWFQEMYVPMKLTGATGIFTEREEKVEGGFLYQICLCGESASICC